MTNKTLVLKPSENQKTEQKNVNKIRHRDECNCLFKNNDTYSSVGLERAKEQAKQEAYDKCIEIANNLVCLTCRIPEDSWCYDCRSLKDLIQKIKQERDK